MSPAVADVSTSVCGKAIHVAGSAVDRAAPAFDERATSEVMLETGIKVIDLIAPYLKGGKIGLFGAAGVGERTREGNDLWLEMESGIVDPTDYTKSKVALVYGQMTEPPGARLRVGLTA